MQGLGSPGRRLLLGPFFVSVAPDSLGAVGPGGAGRAGFCVGGARGDAEQGSLARVCASWGRSRRSRRGLRTQAFPVYSELPFFFFLTIPATCLPSEPGVGDSGSRRGRPLGGSAARHPQDFATISQFGWRVSRIAPGSL